MDDILQDSTKFYYNGKLLDIGSPFKIINETRANNEFKRDFGDKK